MHMALRNVNSLLRMTTNLINFERAEVYSPHLYIAEYELNTYIKEIYNNFQTYATIKHITFRYESNFSYMNVWFDKEKMDSILENVISNALKYTPQNGDILISVYDMKSSWRLEVKDNGIGIPAKAVLSESSFPKRKNSSRTSLCPLRIRRPSMNRMSPPFL